MSKSEMGDTLELNSTLSHMERSKNQMKIIFDPLKFESDKNGSTPGSSCIGSGSELKSRHLKSGSKLESSSIESGSKLESSSIKTGSNRIRLI